MTDANLERVPRLDEARVKLGYHASQTPED